MSSFSITRLKGDTIKANIVCTKGAALRDITGDSIEVLLKYHKTDTVPLVTKSVGSGITKVDSPNGAALLTITPSDLAAISAPVTLYMVVRVTEGDTGDVSSTEGVLILE